ncbi:hypothetical protein [Streptomyces sp. NBC_01373]|uniref:hypothetical protein n=1 Tax=Streptomyces sp. NBC_01373 TaxID=2903843 RepID=UPI002256543D|nr:hypothetical protein [Streptomyces sp. NBC_01373]MCX4703860.1 hypothetical protein [Streptomyces sp. NBC_01373]
MGYKGTPRTVKIDFAQGHEHHGAEARVRRMSFGEWEAILEGDDDNAVAEFAKRLVSWNLEDDDDQPLPATPEGLRMVDTSLVTALKEAWLQSITGVHAADPLPQSSPSGGPSLVESIPMEALSPSLAS